MNERALVVLVGGTMHGTHALVPWPEERMTIEPREGESIDYRCRRRRRALVHGSDTPVALYAPDSITDMEFEVLALDAIRISNAMH